MTIEIEKVILRNLQYNEDFARKVLPFIKEEYFLQDDDRLFFARLLKHFTDYNALPTKEAMILDIQNLKLNIDTLRSAIRMSEDFSKDLAQPVNKDWLLEQTEEFCKDKALYLALQEAIQIKDGNNKSLNKTAIPDIMAKALAVSFDSDIGHNYLKDTDKRYEFYTTKHNKVKFHLDSFNKITNGGAERKTLNAVVAGTNAGKSVFLCDLAANYLLDGYNVLYITLEMADMKIAQRIDANLMNMDINDIDTMPKILWDEKVEAVKSRCKGKLVFKEYPTSGANAAHFRFLIRELKQKQNFIPDIIMIDYINITASVRYKNAAESYGYMKGVTEELRGLMVECNAIGWTGVQFNRQGINNSDADMTNTGESMGIVHTLDFLVALIVSEDLIQNGQVMIKQLKSRYGDVNKIPKFMVGLDRPKMRFYELTNSGTSYTPPKPVKSAPNRTSPSAKSTPSAVPPPAPKNTKGVKL